MLCFVDIEILSGLVPTLFTLIGIGVMTSAISFWLGLEKPWLQPMAIVRAIVQLTLLSLILAGVISNLWLTFLFLALMVSVSSITIRERMGRPWSDVPFIAVCVFTAVSLPMGLIFATNALPFEGRYLLSVGGILIGNTMIASSLMGREVAKALTVNVDEIEGWLSLGAPMTIATRDVLRRAGSTAVIPGTDTTRNIGIVTLPGAFVGAIFGGADVIEAGRFQLLVSSSILAVGIIVVALWTLRLRNPTTISRGETSNKK